jgi:hypothetical protein
MRIAPASPRSIAALAGEKGERRSCASRSDRRTLSVFSPWPTSLTSACSVSKRFDFSPFASQLHYLARSIAGSDEPPCRVRPDIENCPYGQ